MSNYSKFSLERLIGTTDILTSKLWELKLYESLNQAKIQTIDDELEQMDQALKERTEAGLASPIVKPRPVNSPPSRGTLAFIKNYRMSSEISRPLKAVVMFPFS